MLSLTTARAPTPKSIPLREHLRLDAKTTLHYNSFGLLKMCPCTSYTGAHLTLSKKTPLPPREEVGNTAWVKTHSLFSQYVNQSNKTMRLGLGNGLVKRSLRFVVVPSFAICPSPLPPLPSTDGNKYLYVSSSELNQVSMHS